MSEYEQGFRGPFKGVKKFIVHQIMQALAPLEYQLLEQERQMTSLQRDMRELTSGSRQFQDQILNRMSDDDKTVIAISEKLENVSTVVERGFHEIADCQNKIQVFSRLEERLSSNDITIQAISKKLDCVEEHVDSNMSRVEILETGVSTIKKYAEDAQEKLRYLNDQGVSLTPAGVSFNMLDKRTNSQAGEDSILAYITAVLGIPFNQCDYIDLGANQPKEMSNTYFFYSHGARGVLVEANPQLIPALKFYRNGDIVLNNCVDTVEGNIVEFNILNIDGLSTVDARAIEEIQQENGQVILMETVPVETITINRILDTYFQKAPVVLSIDVEGKDLEILESLNWSKYRPLIVIVEMIPYSTRLTIDVKDEAIMKFMLSHEYKEFAFTGINSIFIDAQAVDAMAFRK